MRAEWLGAALAGTRLGFHVRDVLLRVLPARERAGQPVAAASGERSGCSPRQRCGLHGGLEARRHLRSAVRVPVSPAPEEAARGARVASSKAAGSRSGSSGRSGPQQAACGSTGYRVCIQAATGCTCQVRCGERQQRPKSDWPKSSAHGQPVTACDSQKVPVP